MEAVAAYGCAKTAPNGFTYTADIVKFFHEWENEIESEMEDCDVSYDALSPGGTMSQLKTAAVWWIVESVCGEVVANLQPA